MSEEQTLLWLQVFGRYTNTQSCVVKKQAAAAAEGAKEEEDNNRRAKVVSSQCDSAGSRARC